MAIAIISQPAIDTVVAAYEPIKFIMFGSQMPNSAAASPVIIADIYLDGVYYQSINVTDYDIIQIWILTFYVYTFDISDKVQEYLNCNLPKISERINNKGDVENKLDEIHSASVQVKFRESYIDTNGITQFYGTAPIAGTKYTAPVAGTGTVTSNLFYSVNANLRHEDNPDFMLHIQNQQPVFQNVLQLSHRPNFRSYYNITTAGGKYYIGRNDNDYISVFMNGQVPTGFYIGAIVKYKDGTQFSTPYIGPIPNGATTPTANKVWVFNGGIPSIRGYFPSVNWLNVIEYQLFIFLPFIDIINQYYYVVDQCEYYRLFFRSTAGGWDAINLIYAIETTTTESGTFKTTKNPNLGKSAAGFQRLQSTQGEVLTLQNTEYSEKDQKWLKELDASPQAFLYWPGEQGQNPGLIPVVIMDTARATLKNEDRHDYLLTVKLKRANDVVPLRT
jgi:hypothetical protein